MQREEQVQKPGATEGLAHLTWRICFEWGRKGKTNDGLHKALGRKGLNLSFSPVEGEKIAIIARTG